MIQRRVYRFSAHPQPFSDDQLKSTIAGRAAELARHADTANAILQSPQLFSDSDANVEPQAVLGTLWLPHAIVIDASPERHAVLVEALAPADVHDDYRYELPAYDAAPSAQPPALWNHDVLGLAEFRKRHGYIGRGVRIGVVDTGIFGPHFGSKLHAFAYVGADLKVDATAPATEPRGLQHGTHVAGIICDDVFGVAPGATLRVASAMNGVSGFSTWGQVNAALEWLLEDPDLAAINLSIGAAGKRNDLDDVLELIASRGVAIFAASGNVKPGQAAYPGSSPHCFSVGAFRADGTLRPRSGSGPSVPKVIAPGELIASVSATGEKLLLTGTSQAAPHAAAAFALLKEAVSTASSEQILQALSDTARLLPAIPAEHQGRGLFVLEDALSAVQLAVVEGPGVQSELHLDFDDISEFTLSLAACDLIVEPSGSDVLRLAVQGFVGTHPAPVPAPAVTRTGGALVVTQRPGPRDVRYEVVVSAPPLERLDAQVDTGSVAVRRTSAKRARLTTTAAPLVVTRGTDDGVTHIATVTGSVECTPHHIDAGVTAASITGTVRTVLDGTMTAHQHVWEREGASGMHDVSIHTVTGDILIHL